LVLVIRLCGFLPTMSSSASTPRSPRDLDDSASDGSDIDYQAQDTSRAMASLEKQAFLARRDVAFDVPDEVWLQERRCLLMLLEARMLLRELVEYKVKMMRMASGNLTISEIQNLLALYSENDDDGDFISEIQELKRQLVAGVRANHALEGDLHKLDQRIALLIQNRTSIQEIDRQLKKKKVQDEAVTSTPSADFSGNKKVMEGYSNLFYALQVEPKYLAKIARVVPAGKMDAFIELLLLTLYGDSYSPREEYLILQLFKHSMEHEIAALKNGTDLLQSDSVVPKMVLTYNKRKQGVEYIKTTFTSFVKEVMLKDYQFELSPLTIYRKLQNDSDVKDGKKKGAAAKQELTAQEAAADPQVKAKVQQRAKELEEVCKSVLDRALTTMKSLPYGLRLICKQIRQTILLKFPKIKPDDIWTIIGYFVYYRFIGLAIVSPDSFGIADANMSMTSRKNLAIVSKVLMQLMFRLAGFPDTDELAPLNSWILSNRKRVIEYYSELIDVPQPEDYLQVNQYMELTQKTKPIIIVSMGELVLAHQLVKEAISSVVTDVKNDPLSIIINDLGEIPTVDAALAKRELQLQLENRFKGTMEDEVKPGAHLYAETKELIIQIFKVIPIKTGPQTLASILKDASKFAKDNGNKVLGKNVDKTLKNLEKLESMELVSKADKYTSLLKDVALEVANRAERREAQQKEIARLKFALRNLKKHGEFMENQIEEFNRYLESCRKSSLARAKVKAKPVKFTYKELVKRRVILDSAVSDSVANGMLKFFISMPQAGIFDIEAKAAGISAATARLELEDLLEKKENHINALELDQVTLSVPETIFLINKTFLS
jgi:Ras GTPase-activating-like protein IQGAP2/3